MRRLSTPLLRCFIGSRPIITPTALLETLIEAVLDCAPRIRGLQLDHAGPLYHGLLQTARYDGSFYTSTSAAVLLAELAMPPDWLVVEDSWADADRLTNLKDLRSSVRHRDTADGRRPDN